MGPRWHKAVRDLTGYRSRTLLVVVSIALGVFAVGTIAETRIVLERELSAAFLATDPSSARLTLAPFDNALVTAVRRAPGVAAAEGRRTVTVQVRVGPDRWDDLDLTVISDFDAQAVDRVTPAAGVWPPPPGSLLVERSALGLLGGAGIGDTLTVETPDQRAHELTLAGTAYAAGELPGFATGHPFGYVTLDTLEELGFGRDYDELRIRVSSGADDAAQITAVMEEVADQARDAGHELDHVTVPTPLEHPAHDILDTLFVILAILGVLTLVVSVFLVVNTVSAVIAIQTRQIGVMKAIGARNRQLAGLYAGLVMGYGLLAVVVAVPLGVVGATTLTAFTAGLVNLDAEFAWPPLAIVALELGIGLLVPLLAAIPPVTAGVRVTIRQAIASGGIAASFGLGRFDRAIARVGLLPRAARFSLRNTVRKRGRLGLTLAALALGGAVFMAVLSVRASLGATLDRGVAFFGFDAQARLAAPSRASSMVLTAEQVPNVASAEAWLVRNLQRVEPDGSNSKPYPVFGTPAGSETLRPVVTEGRWLLPADANALVATDNVREDEPDLRVGQTLELADGDRISTWTVVGIVEAPTRRQAFYANLEPLAAAVGAPGRASVVVVTTTSHDRETQDRVASELRRDLQSTGVGVASTITIGYVRDQQTVLFDILLTFLAVMALLAGAVGGIGLSGTMSLNVSERAREIGVLRAIGASNAATRTIFLVEGWFIGLLAWAIGVVVALPMSLVMSSAIGRAFVGRPLDFAFSPAGVVAWLAVVLVVSTLATLAPALAAARVTVREALAYE